MPATRYAVVKIASLLLLGSAGSLRAAVADKVIPPTLPALVEADWDRQEQRAGRTADAPAAIRELLRRAERLLVALRRMPDAPDLHAEQAAVERCARRAADVDRMTPDARRTLYRQLRGAVREAALKNPLLAAKPLVFLQRRRFISQMLHEYLGYFYDYGDVAGGGVYVLEEPGRSLRVRDLIGGRLPRGNYTTLALAPDGQTVYFAYCERAARRPEYGSAEQRWFHLYAVQRDGSRLRQLTTGPYDDFDPCPLADGGLAFMSTRRGGFGRCHNPWEPLPAYTLHRMQADGSQLRTLSVHETNEWHPSLLADGRILYTRWDYVDRSAAHFHGLWTSHPDGSHPAVLFGNYTQRINACYQGRPIPGSPRVLFVAGAHHADVGGALVIVDPRRARLDPQTGEDDFSAVEYLTPEVCLPEAPQFPTSYFHSPTPLSEDFFLVSFSFDPLPGMSARTKQETYTGLYYFDRFGNLELLYSRPDVACMYPTPLAPRPTPAVLPGAAVAAELRDAAELVLRDVRESLAPQPAGRPVRALRVYQVLPKTHSHVANRPRIGYANAESARMLLGTVPVEADGSAYFRVPAGKPIYFQAVDANGRAVQTMRSVTYLQPGERRGCVGCHERPGTAPPAGQPLALRRAASRLEPGPDGTRPMSFPRLVQPVLDRYCVRCHDGRGVPGHSRLALTGTPAGTFSRAYESLRPFVRWYEWGRNSIAQISTRPGHGGADESPLTAILDDAQHGPALGLAAADRQRILLWLDSNAPFYGTYAPEEQRAQLAGGSVRPPWGQ
jgi:hypothetical protein